MEEKNIGTITRKVGSALAAVALVGSMQMYAPKNAEFPKPEYGEIIIGRAYEQASNDSSKPKLVWGLIWG